MILDTINELIEYEGLIFKYSDIDKIYYRNLVLAELNIDIPKTFECDDFEFARHLTRPDSLINELYEYITKVMNLNDSEAKRKICQVFGLITPPNSLINEEFVRIEKKSPDQALEYLYNLSIANNYIQKSQVEKNIVWKTDFKTNNLEISINLSKPEKNVKDIAQAASKTADVLTREKYPLCDLCLENVGFLGNDNHPSKVNLRVIPMKLDGDEWYFQYSPYGYYNMHCIVLSKYHNPMIINSSTFKKLVDFVDRFPSFFIGSNADLPIVGGSILNHEHFQGGQYTLPIMKAKNKKEYKLDKTKNVTLHLVDWYNTTLLLTSTSKADLVSVATKILNKWREYTDEDNEIIASDKDGLHNTITPSLRKVKDKYELYLILRNNRTSYKYPDGIFHAHEKYYHIKKENIGIIEAMGLFILPARLVRQINTIKESLKNNLSFDQVVSEHEDLKDFAYMYETLKSDYNEKTIDSKIKSYINNVCKNILLNTSVFKDTDRGRYGIDEFIKRCNL